jgi:hypothetical protein
MLLSQTAGVRVYPFPLSGQTHLDRATAPKSGSTKTNLTTAILSLLTRTLSQKVRTLSQKARTLSQKARTLSQKARMGAFGVETTLP